MKQNEKRLEAMKARRAKDKARLALFNPSNANTRSTPLGGGKSIAGTANFFIIRKS